MNKISKEQALIALEGLFMEATCHEELRCRSDFELVEQYIEQDNWISVEDDSVPIDKNPVLVFKRGYCPEVTLYIFDKFQMHYEPTHWQRITPPKGKE